MANLDSLRHSIRNLNKFIKEKAVVEGRTFENQAIFEVLFREYTNEFMKAKQSGVSLEKVDKILQEENKGMNEYMDLIAEMTKAFMAKNPSSKNVIH